MSHEQMTVCYLSKKTTSPYYIQILDFQNTHTSDGGASPPDKAPVSPGSDPEIKMEDCRQNIRKAQVWKESRV